jgi:serine/threonine protein kinase
MPLRIERQSEPIPGYRLLDRLGSGGYGEVWKAEAPGGLLKAIKIVQGDPRSGNPDAPHLAAQELKALRRVQAVRHPYLLSIDRYDVIEGRLLIVTELADCSLWDRFREFHSQGRPGIPRDDLIRYLLEAAEVLDLMQGTHQLQHLDVKPQNLFLVQDHVKVGDFGLVEALEAAQAVASGGVSPFYAAPETFDGAVSRHCDQYSLAIVYQELLTGQRPFTGGSVQQVIFQHLSAPANLSNLPPADRHAVARALHKRPDERFPNCLAFVKALRDGSAAPRDSSGMMLAVMTPSGSSARMPAVTPSPGSSTRLPPVTASSGSSTRLPPVTSSSGSSTRLPAVSPSSGSSTRLSAGTPFPGGSGRMPALTDTRRTAVTEPVPAAPRVERTGGGVLTPAVVVGLGGTGRVVLQRLRQALTEQAGPPDRLPHLRLLYVDTDADDARAALEGSAGPALAPDEVLPARLQRAGYYLKPRSDGRPIIAGWCDPLWLNRLSRHPATQGLRALGRLAFADHFRALAQKLESDLSAVIRPDALAGAEQHTGLGLRSDRPRVYVVAHLAGGTGGGMALDVAYLARHLLRRLGDPNPDVAGWLLVPPAGADAHTTANAFAALTELHHYSQPYTGYRARCDDPDGALSTRDAPFGRLVVLPLAAGDGAPPVDGPGLAADGLLRELLTPLGRALDARRDAAGTGAPGAECRTFGLTRLAGPGRALAERVARRLGLRLLERWTNADTAPLRHAVHAWVAEQWSALELGPEPLTRRFHQACAEALGQPVEEAFASLASSPAGRGHRAGDPTAVVLDMVVRGEELVGRPADETSDGLPGRLPEALSRATEGLIREWGSRVTQLAVCLIEQPDFRLAGAETAIRLLHDSIERALAHFGPLADEWLRKSAQASARVHALLASGLRRPVTDLAEAARLYPRWRFQGLLYRQVAAIYRALRSQLTDELNEVGLCRALLSRVLATLKARDESDRAGDAPTDAAGWLLPDGCKTLDEAVEQLLAGITRDDLRELDRRAQQMMQARAGGLARACLTATDLPQTLGPELVALAREFLAPRLGAAGTVEAFLARHPGPAAGTALASAWAGAVPLLAAGATGAAELAALVLPDDPASPAFDMLACRALPGTDVTVVASPADVVLYREVPRLPLSALPQLGPEARETYRKLRRAEGFSPHARADVAEWNGVPQ